MSKTLTAAALAAFLLSGCQAAQKVEDGLTGAQMAPTAQTQARIEADKIAALCFHYRASGLAAMKASRQDTEFTVRQMTATLAYWVQLCGETPAEVPPKA